MDSASVLTLVGIVLTAAGIYVPIRRSITADKAEAARRVAKEQQDAVDKAVAAAVAPLVDKIHDLTRDFEYQRDRADDLQAELNRRSAP